MIHQHRLLIRHTLPLIVYPPCCSHSFCLYLSKLDVSNSVAESSNYCRCLRRLSETVSFSNVIDVTSVSMSVFCNKVKVFESSAVVAAYQPLCLNKPVTLKPSIEIALALLKKTFV